MFEAGKIILAISVILWVMASYGPGEKFNNAKEIVTNENVSISAPELEDKIAAYRLEHSYIGIVGKTIEPVIKLTANPLTVKGMEEHIDCDVSKILSREMNMSQAGDELIKTTMRVANGRLTCAEALGHKEFVMTKLYRSA